MSSFRKPLQTTHPRVLLLLTETILSTPASILSLTATRLYLAYIYTLLYRLTISSLPTLSLYASCTPCILFHFPTASSTRREYIITYINSNDFQVSRMARTQAQRESRSDCKKKNCMDGKGCIICGTEIRILLEHSHWIPKYVFKAVRYFQGDSKLQAIWIKCGYNTVPMCSNHHKLYEKKQLSDKDYSKIKREVDKRFKELKKLTKDPRYSSIIPALKKFMGRDYGI